MRRSFVVLTVFALMAGPLLPRARADEPLPSRLVEQAQQGNAEAQYELGQRYRGGRGVPQSEDDAVAWYRKSAVQGYAPAEARLGGLYLNGYGGLPRDANEARKWLKKAALQGDNSAKLELSMVDNALLKWERTLPPGARNAVFFGVLALVPLALVGLLSLAVKSRARAAHLVIGRRSPRTLGRSRSFQHWSVW